jgi:hypothetical protein
MNIDHPDVSVVRVLRLSVVTALFATACGLPDSVVAISAAIRALLSG